MEKLYKASEIAKMLNVGYPYIDELFRRYNIQFVKQIGRKRLFNKKALDFAKKYIDAKNADKIIYNGKEYITIKQISKETGINSHELRYYARQGMINHKFILCGKKWFNAKKTLNLLKENKEMLEKGELRNPINKPSKCWDCHKANDYGCDWFASRYKVPVKGWKATHPLNGYGKEIKNSYIVIECPEFEEDYYVDEKGKRRLKPLSKECELGKASREADLKMFLNKLG